MTPPSDCGIRTPDLTNLFKAIEDPLQGIIITNDKNVVAQYSTRILCNPPEQAWVEVWAVPPPEDQPPGVYQFRPWEWQLIGLEPNPKDTLE
jgi:hypothetical protein